MFALLSGLNPAKLAQLMVNVLAVGGGFLLGYVVFWAVGRAVDRWLFRRKTPFTLQKAFRLLGGLIGAILVALIVFGHGQGWTLFGGGLEGTDNGTGRGPGTTAAGKPEPSTEPVKPAPVPAPDGPAPQERLKVTILGGADVADQKFYLVGDDPTPRAFADVKEAALRKKESTPKRVAVEIRFTARNTLPQDHPAVLRLTNWARENGLAVTFPAES